MTRWFALGLALVLLLAGAVYLRDLPGPQGTLGHDYAYFLPRMLAGDYWFARNGAFRLPWYSPAFGAGLPFYAHPASSYVSLPQALSFVVNPILALQLTLLATVALAFVGMWLLLRRVFMLSESSALLGSTLFALNGFQAARMLIGHLSLHSSALAPLIAYLLLRPLPEKRGPRILLDALLAGLAITYLFQSGNIYGLPPVLLACIAIACLAALAGRETRGFALRLALAALVALVLCAEKLQGSFEYLASFPREGYPLPGAHNPFVLARILFCSLFLAPPTQLGNRGFEGLAFPLGRHEWEYGLSLVPLFVIAIAALRGFRKPRVRPLALLVLVLALPFVLNLHGETWTAFLKSVPIVKSSSSFVRWFFTYVPFVAVLAALACERLRPARFPAGPALLASALATFLLLSADRSLYAREGYDPRDLVEAWQTRSEPPPIHAVVVPPVIDGQMHLGPQRDDGLTRGESQLYTYEPLFGYRLEWFPRGSVHAGEALSTTTGGFNFHDPRAFLNGHGPGTPFAPIDRSVLDRFLRYEPLDDSPTSFTPVLIALALLAAGVLAWRVKRAV